MAGLRYRVLQEVFGEGYKKGEIIIRERHAMWPYLAKRQVEEVEKKDVERLPVIEVSIKHIIAKLPQHDLDDLKRDIEKYGQCTPIYLSRVGRKWAIEEGIHRYNTMKELGYKKIKAKDVSNVKYNYEETLDTA